MEIKIDETYQIFRSKLRLCVAHMFSIIYPCYVTGHAQLAWVTYGRTDYPVSPVTSTPCKDKGHPAAFPSIPVSPITGQEGDETSSGAKKTRVLVTVEWPSRTKDNRIARRTRTSWQDALP